MSAEVKGNACYSAHHAGFVDIFTGTIHSENDYQIQ